MERVSLPSAYFNQNNPFACRWFQAFGLAASNARDGQIITTRAILRQDDGPGLAEYSCSVSSRS